MSDTLMISVSGVRGLVGTDLTPEVVARWAAAFGAWATAGGQGRTVVLGRDARTSGPMFARAATSGLMSVGCDVIDVGVVPTPTVQLAVEHHAAAGGIILTASHNPIEWNALKFVGPDGIFIGPEAGTSIRETVARDGFERAGWDAVGTVSDDDAAVARHADAVLARLERVDTIRARAFHVVLDCVRGAGGVIMPTLLERLGCTVVTLNAEADGRFPRPPEPIPENLAELAAAVSAHHADIGLAVDPDVDRLAIVDNTGRPIGEDYTLAFAVRAVLAAEPAEGRRPVVCNLSTSLVVEDAARDYGRPLLRTPVGEAHVARRIIAEDASIGGEGNGGVMDPRVHVGRDAPLAAAHVLDYLASTGRTVAEAVAAHPRYEIVKARAPRIGSLESVYSELMGSYPDAEADRQDGLRLAWPDRWVHIRPSGTEPIVRCYAEAPTAADARELVASCQAAFGAQEEA